MKLTAVIWSNLSLVLFLEETSPKHGQSKHIQLVTFERPLWMKENRDAIYNAIYHGTITKLRHTEKKIYTHTPTKKCSSFKRQYGKKPIWSPQTIINWQFVFFFIFLLSMTPWYTLICWAQTESKKCQMWKRFIPKANLLVTDDELSQSAANSKCEIHEYTASQVEVRRSCSLGLSVHRYPLNIDILFQFTIISQIHLNLYHITQYVTTAKHKITQMKLMLYRCTTLQRWVWSHCGNDGSQVTSPCSAV